MTTPDMVSKLWNLCNVLKDDGVTHHPYVTGHQTNLSAIPHDGHGKRPASA